MLRRRINFIIPSSSSSWLLSPRFGHHHHLNNGTISSFSSAAPVMINFHLNSSSSTTSCSASGTNKNNKTNITETKQKKNNKNINRTTSKAAVSVVKDPSSLKLFLPQQQQRKLRKYNSTPSPTTPTSPALIQALKEEKFLFQKSLRDYRDRLALQRKKKQLAIQAWNTARELAGHHNSSPPPSFDSVLTSFFFDLPHKWSTTQEYFWILRHLHPHQFIDFDLFHKNRLVLSSSVTTTTTTTKSDEKNSNINKNKMTKKPFIIIGTEQDHSIEFLDDKKIFGGKNKNSFSASEARSIIDGFGGCDTNSGRIAFRLWITLSSVSEFRAQTVLCYLPDSKLVCIKKKIRCVSPSSSSSSNREGTLLSSYRFVPATKEQWERVWEPRTEFKGSAADFRQRIIKSRALLPPTPHPVAANSSSSSTEDQAQPPQQQVAPPRRQSKKKIRTSMMTNEFGFRSGGFHYLEERFPFSDFHFATGLVVMNNNSGNQQIDTPKTVLKELEELSRTKEAKKQIKMTKALIRALYRNGKY